MLQESNVQNVKDCPMGWIFFNETRQPGNSPSKPFVVRKKNWKKKNRRSHIIQLHHPHPKPFFSSMWLFISKFHGSDLPSAMGTRRLRSLGNQGSHPSWHATPPTSWAPWTTHFWTYLWSVYGFKHLWFVRATWDDDYPDWIKLSTIHNMYLYTYIYVYIYIYILMHNLCI